VADLGAALSGLGRGGWHSISGGPPHPVLLLTRLGESAGQLHLFGATAEAQHERLAGQTMPWRSYNRFAPGGPRQAPFRARLTWTTALSPGTAWPGSGIAVVNDFKSVEGDAGDGAGKSLRRCSAFERASWISGGMIDLFQTGDGGCADRHWPELSAAVLLVLLIIPQIPFPRHLAAAAIAGGL